mgnify:CR=1 FL=1
MIAKEIRHAFFIGDVHLDSRKPDREKAFCRLLDSVVESHPDQVFLMGDIFEFWYGYKKVMFSEYVIPVIKIHKLVESGIPVAYMSGNHDFHPGMVFEEKLKIEVFHEPVRVKIEDHYVYVAHGDQINASDWKYLLLRKTLRNPIMQFLWETFVPPSLAWYIGRGTSDSSRKLSDDSERPISKDDFDSFCRREVGAGVNVVLHGHNHNQGVRTWEEDGKKLKVIDTGAWLGEKGHYIEYVDGEFICRQWPI